TYADYTASGRALSFVEDFIRDEVLPRYANTHTESSGTGLQTTRLREDARRIIHSAVGADDDYAVIFAGSGCTGAIDKLIGDLVAAARARRAVLLGLRGSRALRRSADDRRARSPRRVQGRGVLQPAQVHRRAEHAGRPGGPPRPAHQPSARRAGRRHRRIRQ